MTAAQIAEAHKLAGVWKLNPERWFLNAISPATNVTHNPPAAWRRGPRCVAEASRRRRLANNPGLR